MKHAPKPGRLLDVIDSALVSPFLLFLRACDCSSHAKHDIDTSRDIPLALLEAHIPGEQLPHGRSEEGVETIRTGGQQHEQHSKDENLPCHCPSDRIDKLGQERVKEEGRLGIEQLHQESL